MRDESRDDEMTAHAPLVVEVEHFRVSGEADDARGHAGLFMQFAKRRLFQRLADFDDAARQREHARGRRDPRAEQHAAIAKNRDAGRENRTLRDRAGSRI